MSWSGAGLIGSKKYTCSFCNSLVASASGYTNSKTAYVRDRKVGSSIHQKIYICPNCGNPTFFSEEDEQIPDVAPGNNVLHLPDEIDALYNEARKSISVSAYTGSVLLCRKLLMNISVSLGADPGKQFIFYVNYLAEQGYIPPNGRGWVDHIRKKGNEATHEIALMTKQDAEELVLFVEMLMKFIYEFPKKIP